MSLNRKARTRKHFARLKTKQLSMYTNQKWHSLTLDPLLQKSNHASTLRLETLWGVNVVPIKSPSPTHVRALYSLIALGTDYKSTKSIDPIMVRPKVTKSERSRVLAIDRPWHNSRQSSSSLKNLQR